jgi:hypothetical protein
MPWRLLVAITDSGTPGLSATSNFTVTVNPTTHPGVGSVTILGGRVNLVAGGPQGRDYTVLTSTRTPKLPEVAGRTRPGRSAPILGRGHWRHSSRGTFPNRPPIPLGCGRDGRTPPTQKFNFGVRVENICHRLGNELNYTIPKIMAEGFYQTRNTIVLQLKISVAGWSHKNLPQ